MRKKIKPLSASKNLLDINFENKFDVIVSFETVEHFDESDMGKLMSNFHKALKDGGLLIFSTPYNQEKSQASMKWHKTFYITEGKIPNLLGEYFEVKETWYQDYATHDLKKNINTKNFIFCVARKL